jgi:hypothetical protein
MKKLLIAIGMFFSFTVQAQEGPTWQQKPVQCGNIESVYQAYIDPSELRAMFVGVSNSRTHNMIDFSIPVIYFLNAKTGQWILVEVSVVDNWACVTALGDKFDAQVDDQQIRELLLGGKS